MPCRCRIGGSFGICVPDVVPARLTHVSVAFAVGVVEGVAVEYIVFNY